MNLHKLCIAAAIALTCDSAHARFETLFVSQNMTNTVTVGSNETARIQYTTGDADDYNLTVTKDGQTARLRAGKIYNVIGNSGNPQLWELNAVIAGPATIQAAGHSNTAETRVITVEIIPDFYPPDKTLVIPDGQSAHVVLEKSIDLIHWEEASPGIYNNTNSGKHVFFRINAEILSGP